VVFKSEIRTLTVFIRVLHVYDFKCYSFHGSFIILTCLE